MKITGLVARDVRFPTSDYLDGSDAMHPDPDYSCAYVSLEGVDGYGLSFTIGRGTEVVVAGIEALEPLVAGVTLDDIEQDPAAFARRLTGDGQLRWLGPEKGVIHLAASAVLNATWDALARRAGKPLWKYLADMSPGETVRAIDFRHITDALAPDEALDLLRSRHPTRAEREREMRTSGYPAYTTSAGWLGYDDEKIKRLSQEAVDAGWNHVKIKVGRDLRDDIRRARAVREVIGPDRRLMLDANQVWEVEQAIEWMRPLAAVDPWWIEEPTSPDDVLGHARIAREIEPIRVATGEHCHNRVMFKQLFQAGAVGFAQIDACRLGGVNEALAVLLMAAKYGVPVCPHAGGVGLCEMVQHLAIYDYVAVGASLVDRVTEHAAHLHEHFTDPITIKDGRYVPPSAPGYSTQMHPESVDAYEFPSGPRWKARR